MPISNKGKISPYKMKRSPINMGTAAKPSPLKIWPVIGLAVAKGVGAKIAAAGGMKAVLAGIGTKIGSSAVGKLAAKYGITKEVIGKAALSTGKTIVEKGMEKTNEPLNNPDPSDPFGGHTIGK
jgi:hypothetical protein